MTDRGLDSLAASEIGNRKKFVESTVLLSNDGISYDDEKRVLVTPESESDFPSPSPGSGRTGTLFQQLLENKEKGDDEYRERHRHLPPKALDEDEVEFLLQQREKRETAEMIKEQEERQQLAEFRQRLASRVIPVEEQQHQPTISVFSQKDTTKSHHPTHLAKKLPAIRVVSKKSEDKKKKKKKKSKVKPSGNKVASHQSLDSKTHSSSKRRQQQDECNQQQQPHKRHRNDSASTVTPLVDDSDVDILSFKYGAEYEDNDGVSADLHDW